jgi:hypothetical protein
MNDDKSTMPLTIGSIIFGPATAVLAEVDSELDQVAHKDTVKRKVKKFLDQCFADPEMRDELVKQFNQRARRL